MDPLPLTPQTPTVAPAQPAAPKPAAPVMAAPAATPPAAAPPAATPPAAPQASNPTPTAPATAKPAAKQLQEDEDAPTLHLLTLPEVFVYKIPPMHGSSGHRAADWQLDKPALTGELRLVSKGDKVYVQIMQPAESSAQLPKLFASCPIKLDSDQTKPQSKLDFFMQSVTDSSRYFVLRLIDERSGRHAFVGMGFQERQSAFDLRAAIDDELKRISRGESEDEDGTALSSEPAVDRSLKEGETIKVNINLLGKNKKKKKKASGSVSLSGLSISAPPGGLKPPPQQAPKRRTVTPPAPVSPPQPGPAAAPLAAPPGADDGAEDEDWGDFQS